MIKLIFSFQIGNSKSDQNKEQIVQSLDEDQEKAD